MRRLIFWILPFLFLSASIGWLVLKPTFDVDGRILSGLQTFLKKEGIDITWNNLAVKVSRVSGANLFVRGIEVNGRDVCVNLDGLRICGKSVAVKGDVNILKMRDWRALMAVAKVKGFIVDGESLEPVSFAGALDINLRHGALKFSGPVRFASGVPGSFVLAGDWKPGAGGGYLNATVSGRVGLPVSFMPSFRADVCRIGINPEATSLVCSLDAELVFDEPKEMPGLKLPRKFRTTVEVAARGSLLNAELSEGTVVASVEPLKMKMGRLKLDVETRFNRFRLGEIEGDVESLFPMHFRAFLSEVDFTEMKKTLGATAYAIPAPFNDLAGTVNVDLQGQFDKNAVSAAWFAGFDLKSIAQRLGLNGQGSVVFEKKNGVTLDADIVFNEVAMAFPRLGAEDLVSPPRLWNDARFISEETDENSDEAFRYAFRFRTADKPCVLYTNVARQPVQLLFDVSVRNDGPVSGRVSVNPVDINAFGREAKLEPVRLVLGERNLVDGGLRVDYADYQVMVKVSGDIEKPSVRLSSLPPLPEDQLLSALLFGRPLDDLQGGEGETVGNVQAAIADQALGVGALFFLASTPIETLTYDPRTNGVSAKVRLAQGTSLTVGAEAGSYSVGLRRRLSRFWTIMTDVGQSDILGEGSVSAFLEWSSRY